MWHESASVTLSVWVSMFTNSNTNPASFPCSSLWEGQKLTYTLFTETTWSPVRFWTWWLLRIGVIQLRWLINWSYGLNRLITPGSKWYLLADNVIDSLTMAVSRYLNGPEIGSKSACQAKVRVFLCTGTLPLQSSVSDWATMRSHGLGKLRCFSRRLKRRACRSTFDRQSPMFTFSLEFFTELYFSRLSRNWVVDAKVYAELRLW